MYLECRFRKSLGVCIICLVITGLSPEVRGQKRIFARVKPNISSVSSSADIYDPAAGAFAPSAASMNKARQAHAASLLRSGKVLVAGGYDGSDYLASAEIYDPDTGAFTLSGGTMTAGRSGHTASLLQSGRVLITGGFGGSYLSSAEVYDPDADSFTATIGTMSAARWGHTATLLSDAKVLITGGFNESYLSSADLYDPAAGTFTATGTMTAARTGHTATLLTDGKVLIVGGRNDSYLSSAEIYDPSTGAFTATTGSLSAARGSHTATLLPDGKVLITGGYNGSYLSSAEIYDPSTGRFTATSGAMASARSGHAAVLLASGKVLITGGYNGSYLNSAETYDPASGTFAAQAGSMADARQLHSATKLNDGRVLTAGGQNSTLLTFDVNINASDNISPNIVLSADSQIGFVPYTGSGVVVAFSPQTGEVFKRIETGGKPAFATPLKEGKTLAVVSALGNKIFLVNMQDLALQSTYTFANAEFGFGSVLTLSPDGSQGYISSTGTGEVIKFSISDGKELGRLKGLSGPAQVTLSPDGTILIVVDTETEEVDFADSSSMTQKYALKTRDKVSTADLTIFNKAVLTQDGYSGIIAARDTSGSLVSGTAFVFKTATGEVLATLTIGSLSGFTGITPDGRNWVTLNEFSLSVIPTSDPASLEEIPTVQGEPLGSANVAFSADSRYALYASSATDLFFQHDLTTTAVVGEVLVGDDPNKSLDQPSSVAIAPDGKTVAVLDFIGNSIDLLTDVTVMSGTKFIASGNQFTGLSLINLSDRQTNITIYALDGVGQIITADDLENPAELELGPNAQISLNVSQIFNFDLTQDNAGRLTVWSDQPQVVGYASVGQITPTWLGYYLNQMDGTPLFRTPLHDWIIPEIPVDSGETVRLNFVNPNYSQGTYDLKHFAADGTLSEEKADSTAVGQSRQEQLSTDLFTTPGQGKVLITGGQTSSSATSTIDSAESYDSTARAFSATGSMTTPRAGHTATTLVNGKVLVTGGKSAESILAAAETYDIAAGTFTATAGAMSSNRFRHTAVLLPSGKVLIAGGQNSVSVNNTAEIYDPATDTFSPTATTMTTPRDGHTATLLLNGKVLLAGGIDGSAVTNSAEMYDPATGQFTATGSMTTARVFHTATRLASGLVLIAGGYNGNYLATAEVFDPATETFRATAGAMTSRRGAHTATLLSDGNVFLAGGSDSTGALKSAETYDPSSDSFAPVATAMTSARSAHTATLLADGTVMIAGGTDGTSVLNTSETYDPETQTFQSAGTMTAVRSGHTATFLQASIGGYVRVSSTPGLLFTEFFGRGNDNGALNGIDVEKYSGVTRLYAPQFAITSDFSTLLNLINANQDNDAQVTLVLHAPDGRVLGTSQALTLPKGAQLKDDLNSIFRQDPSVQNMTGWVEIQSSVDRVVGTISFTNSDGGFLTSFELSGTPLSHFLFPMAAEDSTYQTGIALLNSNDQSAAVAMELWGPEGRMERSATLNLSPGTRTALYLSDYFPGLSPHLVGNIRIRSDQPLHSFSLVNDRSFHFLSAVPAIPFPEESSNASLTTLLPGLNRRLETRGPASGHDPLPDRRGSNPSDRARPQR